MHSYSTLATTTSLNLNTAIGYDNISLDGTSSGLTLTLPTLPLEGYNVRVNRIDTSTNTVTIIPQSGQTLNGILNGVYTMAIQTTVQPFSANNVWYITNNGFIGPVGFTGFTGYTGSTGFTGSTGPVTYAYIFGDGSDGGATFDGVNTFNTYSSLASGIYTLNRDVYLSIASVGSTATIFTNGYRIFANDTFTVGGTVSYAGSSGVSATGGPATATNFIGGGGAGGAGGNNTNGGAGSNPGFNCCGGNGGAGGSGTASRIGGAGGVVSVPLASDGGIQIVNALPYFLTLNNTSNVDPVLKGGAGGGGGGAGSASGGGGGGGGGAMMIAALTLAGNGTITVAGGKGANSFATNGGGGGGGGGGFMVLVYHTKTFSGTLTVAGGAGGTGTGTGTSGTTGSTGLKKEFQV